MQLRPGKNAATGPSNRYPAAAVLVVLVTIAFLGLATSATSVLLQPAAAEMVPAEMAPAGMANAGTAALGSAHGTGGSHGSTDALGRASGVLTPGEPSAWMVIPVLAGLAVLILLGIHPPGELANLITQAATQLRGAP